MDKRHVHKRVRIRRSATTREGRAPPSRARWWARMLALGGGLFAVVLFAAACSNGGEPLALELPSQRAELARGFGVDVPLSRQGGSGEGEVAVEGVPDGVEVDLGAGTLAAGATASVRLEARPDAPAGVHELTIELRTEAETAEAAFTLVVMEAYGAERFSPLEGEVRELSVNGDTLRRSPPDAQVGITLVYEVIEGTAVLQGDIVLGPAAELEAAAQHLSPQAHIIAEDPCADASSSVFGPVFSCETRWPNGVIPFEIADQWGSKQGQMQRRIGNAIQEWNSKTTVLLVPRTGQSAYVRFMQADGCSSWVGRQGGRQKIRLSTACGTGNIIHEIGHAAGLYHEHTRDDRDPWVEVVWDNIDKRKGQFRQGDFGGIDHGEYEYDSIMHYGPKAFGKTVFEPRNAPDIFRKLVTLRPKKTDKPEAANMGQRVGLSDGDIAAINAMYGSAASVEILSPSNGDSFSHNSTPVTFRAEVSDPDGDVTDVTWWSSLDGEIGTGAELTRDDLSLGFHTIQVTVVDRGGYEARDRLSIEIVNDPPTVDIVEPAGFSTFCLGEPVTFRANASDINLPPGESFPGESVEWRLGTAPPFDSGTRVERTFRTEGNYTVVVRATDEEDAFDEDRVNVTIEDCPGAAPEVTITEPSEDVECCDPAYDYDGFDEGRGLWYTDVQLAGEATDDEDGPLSGADLVWTTNRTDLQDGNLGTGTSLEARLYSDTCIGEEHGITLTATDSDGNEDSEVRVIFIGPGLC